MEKGPEETQSGRKQEIEHCLGEGQEKLIVVTLPKGILKTEIHKTSSFSTVW